MFAPMVISGVLMVIASMGMAYQDFKFRTVSLWTLVLLAVSSGIWSVSVIGFSSTIHNWAMNVAFVLIQFGLGALVIGLGKGEWKFFDRYIGWGDLLYLIAVAFAFCTVNFLVFYCVSLLVVLTAFLAYTRTVGSRQTTIPLAGGLSLCSLLFIAAVYPLGYTPWEDLPLYALY